MDSQDKLNRKNELKSGKESEEERTNPDVSRLNVTSACDKSFQAFPPLFVLQATKAGQGGLGTRLLLWWDNHDIYIHSTFMFNRKTRCLTGKTPAAGFYGTCAEK